MTMDRDSHDQEFDNGSGIILDIGIVGAGIAGLTAAAVLGRLGHKIELYEKSRFSNEVGAAINIGPNAGHVLHALGFDNARAQLLKVEGGVQFDAFTMEESYRGSYDDFETRFKFPWYPETKLKRHVIC
ncbi:hypothetical protein BFJ63_vAg17533 [Fusarium oxysporum f. sp. narcissi]|uniref:FAD-binding domain-containing protein n=1 Tax=Fusarium oxysporum f. sp. narcissi TaxID=451672 RepID=A0A4Q2UZJ4_FUSOX|nr:hypothetical protein BFJ63_vAg17533 [Fusarium oxysporum f. sp. narcissi]